MKARFFNIGVLMALAATLFTACDSDRDDNPVVGPNNAPTEFVLNKPAMSEQYIQLSKDNTVNLTWSQPNYAFPVVTTYQVQVGVVQGGSVKWNEDNGQPKYLETTFTSCNANVSGEELAKAICQIDGFATEDDYVDQGFREIAMRIRACIKTTVGDEIEGTSIVSNYVTFKRMAAYCMIPSKTYIYVIGNCSGWQEPKAGNAEALADWRIWETEIGSKIYNGVIEMPDYSSDALQFRFYTKLTGWDGGNSYGTQVEDSPIDCEFSDGVFTGDALTGKGSWKFAGFPGGKLDITVDMNTNKVTFKIVQ